VLDAGEDDFADRVLEILLGADGPGHEDCPDHLEHDGVVEEAIGRHGPPSPPRKKSTPDRSQKTPVGEYGDERREGRLKRRAPPRFSL
jgi:hypothetical protein